MCLLQRKVVIFWAELGSFACRDIVGQEVVLHLYPPLVRDLSIVSSSGLCNTSNIWTYWSEPSTGPQISPKDDHPLYEERLKEFVLFNMKRFVINMCKYLIE